MKHCETCACSSAPEIEPFVVDGRLALAWKTFLLNRGAMSESYYEVARIAFVVAWHAGFSERTNSAPETTVPEKVCRWSPIEEGSLTYQPGCGGEWWTKSERLVELYDYCHHCGGRIEEVSADESPVETGTSGCCRDDPGGGFVCTLPKGHVGQHEAYGTHKNLLQAWPAQKATPECGHDVQRLRDLGWRHCPNCGVYIGEHRGISRGGEHCTDNDCRCHGYPLTQKASTEPHIDYRVAGCGCLACELAQNGSTESGK